MATAKETKLRTERTAKRLDFLSETARVLRDPAIWRLYHEAVHITELLGYKVIQTGGHHEVTPC